MNNGNWLEPPLGNAAKSVVADSTPADHGTKRIFNSKDLVRNK